MAAGGLQQDAEAGDRRELRAARRAAGGELSLSLYTPWWGNGMAAPREGRGAREGLMMRWLLLLCCLLGA